MRFTASVQEAFPLSVLVPSLKARGELLSNLVRINIPLTDAGHAVWLPSEEVRNFLVRRPPVDSKACCRCSPEVVQMLLDASPFGGPQEGLSHAVRFPRLVQMADEQARGRYPSGLNLLLTFGPDLRDDRPCVGKQRHGRTLSSVALAGREADGVVRHILPFEANQIATADSGGGS